MNVKLNPETSDDSQPKPARKKGVKKFYGVIGGVALAAAVAFSGGSLLGQSPATYAQTTTATPNASPSTTSGANPPVNGQAGNAADRFGGGPGPRGGGGPGPHGGGGPGGEGRPGMRGDVSGTISAISGNTITLKRGEVIVITATVNGSTTYTAAGKTLKLTDLVVGEKVSIRTATDGTVTVTAVEVVLDHAGGTISAVDSGSLTLTKGDNSTVKVTLGSGVTVQDLSKTAAVSDLKTGLRVEVSGQLNSDGTLSAQVINIVHDRLGGKVTSISGNTITVEVGAKGPGGPEGPGGPHGRGPGQDGRPAGAPGTGSAATPAAGTGNASVSVTATKTITVSGSTVYLSVGQTIALSGIAVGDRIDAVGTASSDDTSLTALQVTVQLPDYHGQVTSVNGSTIVIKDRDTSLTIEVTSDTKYLNGLAAASLSDVKAGANISATGKVDSSGKMTASQLQIGQPDGPLAHQGGRK